MIMTVGSFMKDTTRDWFDARDKQMRKLQIVDIYKSFVESMDLQFQHVKAAQIATRKLRQVKYQSDIVKYLDTLQQLNMKVGMLSNFKNRILRGWLSLEAARRRVLRRIVDACSRPASDIERIVVAFGGGHLV